MAGKKVRGKKTVFTFTYLATAAAQALREAEAEEEGNFYTSMVCLSFSAFFLEAYLNHLGQELFPSWSDQEKSLNPREKLDILAARLKFKPDFGKRPYQSFTKLFKFRNLMAHGKTEKVTGEWTYVQKKGLAEGPQPTWYAMCEPKEARRRFDDARQIVEELHKKAGRPSKPFSVMARGAWRGQ